MLDLLKVRTAGRERRELGEKKRLTLSCILGAILDGVPGYPAFSFVPRPLALAVAPYNGLDDRDIPPTGDAAAYRPFLKNPSPLFKDDVEDCLLSGTAPSCDMDDAFGWRSACCDELGVYAVGELDIPARGP